ncbi:MAG: hypothetical protein IAX22_06460 [Candidatus Bathyarchaeota archaeon]|nr:hypothetical protein [Candidatus Bathyarchaeota archaeon]
MRKTRVFLIVFVFTLTLLLILGSVSLYLSYASPDYYCTSWMSQMWSNPGYYGMGGMMNNNQTNTILWIIPVTLIIVSIVALIGIAFYLIFPELKYTKNPQQTNSQLNKATPPNNNYDVLYNTMTPDEQKIFTVLRNHQGKYLQKYIAKEAQLNRLKTHRIIARFSQRGIVTVKEFGNTNEVSINDWIKTSKT